jgi:hypothetical protein
VPHPVMTTQYEVSCDRERIDVPLVHAFLRESYRARGRTRETVERSIENSLCFGVYAADRQIALLASSATARSLLIFATYS